DRKIEPADGLAERDEDRVVGLVVEAAEEVVLPAVELLGAAAGELGLVGEVVGAAGERVERGDVRPERARQKRAPDGEIRVVGARDRLAVGEAGRRLEAGAGGGLRWRG